MLNKATVERLVSIVGNGGLLDSSQDLAVYSYDDTFEENLPA